MATQASIQRVAEFTRYNSGTHLLDSGGANGRAWQQPLPGGMFTPHGDDWFGGVSVSLTHIIAEHWDIDEELQNEVEMVWDPDGGKVLFTDIQPSALDRLRIEFPDLMPHVTVLPANGRNVEEATCDVHVDGTDLGFWDVATLVMLLRGYVREARDNSYNGENDLDQVFVWEVWVPEYAAGDDWVWADGARILVYAHTGADVRGGYAKPMVLEGRQYDGNYIETCNGWYPADETTENYCADEGITDHFQVGYSRSPTYELEQAMGPFVRWEQDGDYPVAVFKASEEDDTELRFVPDYMP